MSKATEDNQAVTETIDVPGVAAITVTPGANAWRVSGFGMDAKQARISAEGIARSRLHTEAPSYELVTFVKGGRVRCELGFVSNGGEGA